MSSTLKQIEANRINAQASTGPKSLDGKQQVRFNALRHGLDSNTLVIPGEDADEARAFVEGIVAALAPRDEFEADLCARMARLSWKLLRAERVEQRVTSVAIQRAELDDKIRRQTALHALLSSDPDTVRNIRSQLEESAEGCDWMLSTLREILDALDRKRSGSPTTVAST